MALNSGTKVIIFFQLFEKSEKYFSILHSSLFALHSSPFTFFFFFLDISKLNHTLASLKLLRFGYARKNVNTFSCISQNLIVTLRQKELKTIIRYAAN